MFLDRLTLCEIAKLHHRFNWKFIMTSRKEKALINLTNSAVNLLLLTIGFCVLLIVFLTALEPKLNEPENVLICGTGLLEGEEKGNNSILTKFSLNDEKIEFSPKEGNKFYKVNCASCHKMNESRTIGPGMKGLFDRIPAKPKNWIFLFLTDSDALKKSGDIYALTLGKEYKKYGIEYSHLFQDNSKDGLNDDIGYIYSSGRNY